MKNLFKLHIMLFVTVLVVSCTKDNDEIIPETTARVATILKSDFAKYQDIKSQNEEESFLSILFGFDDCFSVPYPATFIVNDNGALRTVENDDDVLDLFISDDDGVEFLIPNFPWNIILEDGTEKVLNSDDEYFAQIDECEMIQ